MKTSLSIALATVLTLCGCSVFHRSPTWDTVVASRSNYSGSRSDDGKDGYLNRLHQVLRDAGIAHKVVTYQFRFHNVYREENVQTETAILYSDDTTPRSPWWVMDEYHHVPVWLPNWELDAQIEFFIQRPVEIVSVKDYPAGAPQPRVATVKRTPQRSVTHTAREKKFRSLFANSGKAPRRERPVTTPAAPVDSDPLTTKVLASDTSDSRADSLFRSTHGTAYDPTSSVDRAKMNTLRRQWLNRTQRVSLRSE